VSVFVELFIQGAIHMLHMDQCVLKIFSRTNSKKEPTTVWYILWMSHWFLVNRT